jgi:uncharacterized protein
VERITLDEADLIARQIGRPPRGDIAVARRCEHGFPQVLRVRPCVDDAPFPTLYWLSCPFLGRAVADLEAAGWIGRFEQRVAEDDELRASLARAHAEYVAERVRLLDPAERCRLAERGQLESLEARGIGGIADRARLKCLHLHVAHALVGENPIGELVLDLLPSRSCAGKKAICSSLGRERSRSQINR